MVSRAWDSSCLNDGVLWHGGTDGNGGNGAIWWFLGLGIVVA